MASKPPLHTLQAGYFPNALAELAKYIQYGNDKHNSGEPLNWAFHKSTQHAESAQRHLRDSATIDPESGQGHDIGLIWRALALAETRLINAGATPGFAVNFDAPVQPEPGIVDLPPEPTPDLSDLLTPECICGDPGCTYRARRGML
jgi:hypothetical protein